MSGGGKDGAAVKAHTPCDHDWVEDERDRRFSLVETVNYHCSKCPMLRVVSGTRSL